MELAGEERELAGDKRGGREDAQALDGGATRTLRFDQTGKAMGTALLRMEVDVK